MAFFCLNCGFFLFLFLHDDKVFCVFGKCFLSFEPASVRKTIFIIMMTTSVTVTLSIH